MTVALRRPDPPPSEPATLEAFLIWERTQEAKHEFDGFRPLAMTGGTAAHARIQRNLAISIGGRLRGRSCEFLGSDLKILTATSCRYPDGVVTCTAPANGALSVPEPVVVFEVSSRSTGGTDRIAKNREYAAIASVRRYVILEQDRIGAIVFFRSGEDWIGRMLGEDAELVLPEIDVTLPLAELYEGLGLEGIGDPPETGEEDEEAG